MIGGSGVGSMVGEDPECVEITRRILELVDLREERQICLKGGKGTGPPSSHSDDQAEATPTLEGRGYGAWCGEG